MARPGDLSDLAETAVAPSVFAGTRAPALTQPATRLSMPVSSLRPSRGLGYSGEDQGLWDVTGGAALYGGADALSAISRRLGYHTGSETLMEIGDSLEQYKKDHPEYSPTQVDSAWELITSPKALSSRVFGTAPQMIATAALTAIPYAGIPLAMGMTYLIESQAAYDQAIADGATEWQAQQTAGIVGTVNSILELVEVKQLVALAKTGRRIVAKKAIDTAGVLAERSLMEKTLQEAAENPVKQAFARQLLGTMAKEGLEEALQGATGDTTAALIYGKQLSLKGFLDSRLQEALTGGVASAVFGVGGHLALRDGKPELASTDTSDVVADTFGKDSMRVVARDIFGLQGKHLEQQLTAVDDLVTQAAKRAKMSKEEMYATAYAQMLPADHISRVRLLDSGVLGQSLNKVRSVLEEDRLPADASPSDILSYLQDPQVGVSGQQLVDSGVKDYVTKMDPKEGKKGIIRFVDEQRNQYLTLLGGPQVASQHQLYIETSEKEINQLQKNFQKALQAEQQAKTPEEARLKKQERVQAQTLFSLRVKDREATTDRVFLADRYSRQDGDASILRMPEPEDKGPASKPKMLLTRSLVEPVDQVKGLVVQMVNPSDEKIPLMTAVKKSLLEAVGKRVERVAFAPSDAKLQQQFGMTPLQLMAEVIAKTGKGDLSQLQKEDLDKLTEVQQQAVALVKRYDVDLLQAVTQQAKRLGKGGKLQIWDSPAGPLYGFDITEKGKQEIRREGVPLFSMNDYQSMQVGVMYKAVRLLNGDIFIGPFKDHDQLIERMWINRDEIESSGWAKKAADSKVYYSGRADMVGAYQGKPRTPTEEDLKPRVIKDVPTENLFFLRRANALAQMENGKVLGSTVFLEDGRAVIQAFEGKNLSTFIHEVAHVMRRYIGKDDVAILEKWAGVRDGVWTDQAEEKFARGFERYLRDGWAPSGMISDLFHYFKQTLRKIYRNLRKSSINVQISDEMRGVYDRMFVDDTPTITEKRAEIRELNDRLTALEKGPPLPPWQMSEAEFVREFEALRERTEKAEKTPDRLMSPEEVEFMKRDWEGYSRSRGYTEAEIADFRRYQELLPEKYPEEYASTADIHKEHVEKAKEQGLTQASALANSQLANRRRLQERKEIQSLLKLKRFELQKMQDFVFMPREQTDVERKALDPDYLPQAHELLTPSDKRFMQNLREAKSVLGTWLHSQGLMLEKTVSGKRMVQLLTNAAGKANDFAGMVENPLVNVLSTLTSQEKAWLKEINDGQSNFLRMVDEKNTLAYTEPPTPGLARLREIVRTIHKVGQEEARRIGVMRETGSGITVPAEGSDTLTFGRWFTTDAWTAIRNGQGPLYDALARWVREHNEGFQGLSDDTVRASLRAQLGEIKTKVVGAVEKYRSIIHMPDHVEVGGTLIEVMHSNPLDAVRHIARREGLRLGIIEQLGQGVLRDVKDADKIAVIRALSVDKDPAGNRKYNAALSREELQRQLADHGLDPNQLDVSITQLREMSKDAGLSTSIDGETAMNLIEIADPLTFTLEQRAEVRKVAKALKGITLNKGFGALWNELIHRLKTPVFDAYGKLRDMYAKEGGNVDDFDTVFELAQGIPVYNRIKRDPISRTFRTIWDVTGAMQTSLSVAPNMPQVMAQVARYTGLARFAEAVRTSILDPEVTESQLTAMGAFPRAMMSWGSERGYGLETFGRWFKQAVAKGTGAQAIAQWNYTVSGEAFRMLAQSWQAHGIKKGDLTVAQQLSLERGEIEAINSGKMDPATFRKIVQRGVALTQYMTEATFRKSKLENVPLARMLFSYMNYTMGATRAAVTMGKDFATAFKSRDPVLLWGMARRLTAMVAGSVGAGMLSVMLRRALRQDPPPPPEDEEGMQKYVDAMIEVQLFGAAQRATQPTNYDNGITEKYFVGLMPQVSMLTDLFGAVIGGYGRFADFPRGERVSQSLLKNTAVVKAGLKLFQDLAYPDEPQYERTRREVGDWMEKKLGIEKRIQQAEIKPDYYHVFQMIERGDEEGAGEQAQRYYRKVIGQKGDIVKAVRGLRSSLMSRSPIALAGPNLVQFLMTLSPRDRVMAFRTHLTYLQRLNQVAPRI